MTEPIKILYYCDSCQNYYETKMCPDCIMPDMFEVVLSPLIPNCSSVYLRMGYMTGRMMGKWH